MINKSKLINVLILMVVCCSFVISNTPVYAINTASSYFFGYSSLKLHNTCGNPKSYTYERVLCDGVENANVAVGGVFSKDMFISYILSLLNNSEGDAHKQVGASFIIHTMIGSASPDGSITPTEAELAKWQAAIKNANIEVVTENRPYSINSGYVQNSSNGDPDIKFYNSSGTDLSLVFRNATTKVEYYVLKKACANPLGLLNGLPEPNTWSAEPKIKATINETGSTTGELGTNGVNRPADNNGKTIDMAVGETAIWNNIVRFSNGTSSILYSGEKSSDWGGSTEGISISDNTDVAHFSFTAAAGDAGKTFCVQTSISKSAWNSSTGAWSKSACVHVMYNWKTSVQATVDKASAEPGAVINWTHIVTNVGPSATNQNITSHYQDRGRIGSGTGADTVLPSGSIAGSNKTFASSYNVKQSDVGLGDICRATSASPLAWNDSAWIESPEACTKVPYKFKLKPETRISADKQTPGDSITFQHKITNDGKTKTNKDVTYVTRIVRVNSAGNPGINQVKVGINLAEKLNYPAIQASNTGNDDGSARLLIDWFNDSYQIRQDDVNNWVCGYVAVRPASSENGDDVYSYICKFIPYDYTLTPVVVVTPGGVIEGGSSYTASPSVNNSGPTKSESTEWQLTRTIVSPNYAIDNINGGISAVEPCTYYNNANAVCSPVKTGTTVFNNNSTWLSGDILNDYISDAGDYAVGTRICLALSVKPYKNGANTWAHSAAVCLVVGKKPKVQILGGDLLVGGLASSSTTAKNMVGIKRMFGSWVEYGIFAGGLIKGTASGAAFAGLGLDGVQPCSYSLLSFTNAGSSSCNALGTEIGKYNAEWSIPNISASFPGGGEPASGIFVPNSKNVGVNIVSANDLSLDTSILAAGKTVIIKASGTVTIIGNQSYNNGPYTRITDLPQLVIIANKIVINSNVQNVDAWLVTRDGSVETCEQIGNTINKCNAKLTVNGPVVTKKLYLYRTAGSGPGAASGDPAEVFNLRADAYLWANARATTDSKIQTVYTTELPPRF